MNNPPQSVLDAIAQAEREGRVTVQGVGPLPGQHAGPAPGGGVTTPPDTEAAFQKRVLALARGNGWKTAHFSKAARIHPDGSVRYTTPVQGDGKGFPDIVLVRDRIVFVELKSAGGRLRPDQDKWAEWLAIAGGEYHLWRPESWAEIEEVLK